MVRAFDDDEVVHVDDSVDPVRDLETIVQELCKKDQSYVKHCQDEKKKEIKKNPTFKLPPLYYEVMEKVCAFHYNLMWDVCVHFFYFYK